MSRFTRLSAIVASTLLACACQKIDLADGGYPFACDRDAGDSQCLAGWRCGLNGFCQDPELGLPYACATDLDCGAGWHCGPAGVCYDRADAGAVPCRPDAGDCAVGWRCGYSGHCQNPALGAAYPCAIDGDCEQGWRCGPGQTCVDATAEALRPATVEVSQVLPVGTAAFASAPPQAVIGRLSTGVLLTYPPAPASSFYAGPGTLTVDSSLAVSDAGVLSGCAHVDARPDWALACPSQHPQSRPVPFSPILQPARLIAWATSTANESEVAPLLSSTNPDFTGVGRAEPAVAAVAPLVDGELEAVAAIGDTVWTGTLGNPATWDSGAPTGAGLYIELKPVALGQISSLTLTGPDTDGGAPFLSGYLLDSERLFRIRAYADDDWGADEILLPDGDPLALWSDGNRARVGFISGVVYSLPSLVPIAEPLSAPPVQDFAAWCGTGFALSQDGVYELGLNPDGGPVGAWSPVDLSAVPGVADGGLVGGRLISTGHELFLFQSNGAGYVLIAPDGGC